MHVCLLLFSCSVISVCDPIDCSTPGFPVLHVFNTIWFYHMCRFVYHHHSQDIIQFYYHKDPLCCPFITCQPPYGHPSLIPGNHWSVFHLCKFDISKMLYKWNHRRWWRDRTGRPLSPQRIHQKIIWMLGNFHKTTSENWQRTPGTQKGSPFSSKGGRTKYKRQKERWKS